MLTLSTIQPDYEQIRSQLQTLLTDRTAWRDLLPTGTGQTLIDFVAAVGAQDQFAIEHAFREAFRTARLDSSVYAQALMLGVRLSRKIPSSLQAQLTRSSGVTGSIVIPAYTQFMCSSAVLFNREAVVMDSDVNQVTVDLFEGSVVTRTLGSDGSDWQMFISSESAYSVSDVDVRVRVNQITIPLLTRAIWRSRGVQGIQDSTSADGKLLLTFGNDQFGTKPKVNDVVEITYVITKGADANSAATSGRKITVTGSNAVAGVALTSLTAGGNEKQSVFYRKLAPQLFSADASVATTQEEYAAVACSYPGVIDARVLGQRDLAPADNRWMNMQQLTLLTEQPWSADQWDQFIGWYKTRVMWPARFVRKDAQPKYVDLDITVYVQGRADLTSEKAAVEQRIRALFAPRPGIIDTNIYRMDIFAAVKNASDSVEYGTLNNLNSDIIVGIRPPNKLTLIADTGGVLTAGQYSYAVTAVTSQGETLATNWTSVQVGDSGLVTISWTPMAGVIKYNIYGRGVTTGLIGEVDGSTSSFVDLGNVVPVGNQPALNTSGHYYPVLDNLTINMQYTNRNFYDIGELR